MGSYLPLDNRAIMQMLFYGVPWRGMVMVIHPGRLTAGTCPHGGLVQIIFLSKWVICRFHVNLPGCKHKLIN